MKVVFWAVCIFFLWGTCHEVLGQVRMEDERLLDQLKSTDVEVRITALTAYQSRSVDEEKPEADFPALVAIGFALQHDESPLVRALAARVMERNPDPRASEPLLSALRTERAIPVRKAILYALARNSSPQVVQELIRQLDHKDSENRAVAAFTLARINDPAAVQAALNFLGKKRKKDQDVQARVSLIQLLGQQRERSSIDLLLKASNSDSPPELRRAAAFALGKIGTSSDFNVLEYLRKALLDPDPFLVAISEGAIRQVESNQ